MGFTAQTRSLNNHVESFLGNRGYPPPYYGLCLLSLNRYFSAELPDGVEKAPTVARSRKYFYSMQVTKLLELLKLMSFPGLTVVRQEWLVRGKL